MKESPNRFEYFIVMVGNDLVCVFITHICTYHTTHRLQIIPCACVQFGVTLMIWRLHEEELELNSNV